MTVTIFKKAKTNFLQKQIFVCFSSPPTFFLQTKQSRSTKEEKGEVGAAAI